MGSFLPSKDADLLAWGTNFSTRITATPTAFGLVAGDATSFAALLSAYDTALAACDPGTRSKSTVSTKNDARTALRDAAALLSKKVQGTASVTDAQKIDLGLNVRKAPQPIPAPAASPKVDVVSVNQNVVQIKLHGEGAKRGMPAGVNGAIVISWVGENPPADPSLWKTEGVVSKGKLAIAFPIDAEPFSKVWIAASWFNPAKETGPLCPPVSTYLGAWLVESAASGGGDVAQLKAA